MSTEVDLQRAALVQTLWTRLLMGGLHKSGVRDVVVSPGSRSTPLVAAAHATEGLRLHSIIDERSAAFFALGQARIAGRPSVLLCTSGTAGAHYLPAIIEAGEAGVPLIVITSDRPVELADCRAPQTVDQLKLFGDHARRFFDLGAPARASMQACLRVAAQSVFCAKWPKPGAVHLNVRLRKPLEPAQPISDSERALFDEHTRLLDRGPPKMPTPLVTASESTCLALAARCDAAERGLIVCGPAPSRTAAERRAILDFVERTGFELIAEATSQLRFGEGSNALLDGHEPALEARALRPDLIIQVGDPPVSSAYQRFVGAHLDIARVVVDPFGYADPTSAVDEMIVSDISSLLHRTGALTTKRRRPSKRAQDAWRKVAALLESGQGDSLLEGAVVRAVVDQAPARSVLFLGNSLAVRNADLYCPAMEKSLKVLSQRGAAGIDGLISGAAGAASLSRSQVTLLLGDVSALHDLTGLHAALGKKLCVVVVNNAGGRIFEQLPAFSNEAVPFEQLATPHALDFSGAAKMFGVRYMPVGTTGALRDALDEAYADQATCLIEARVDPSSARRIKAALMAHQGQGQGRNEGEA